MTDPRHRELERHSSPFWGVALVFVVVMTGLIAYAYHGAHTIPGSATDQTDGQLPAPSSQPAPQK
jgi:hypothetical protein